MSDASETAVKESADTANNLEVQEPLDSVRGEGTSRKRRSRKTLNLLALVAFVLALVASPLALVFGYIAAGQIRRSDQTGAVLAWIAVGLGWLWLAGFIVVAASLGLIWWENPFWP